MLIVADRNIAEVEAAFAHLGEVRTYSSSELTRENIRDAEILLTRSTVKVGAALLEGSRVRFSATATIGTDHMDIPWLESKGIVWASAPGSNADSVLQWFAAAVLTLHERGALDLAQLRIGIVGVGNVGGRIERFCRAFRLPLLRCDPPRQAREGGDFVNLDTILRESNLITLHVPLDPTTRHFIAPAQLAPGTWFINACRGEVIDGRALLAADHLGGCVLDVFENEPAPAAELIAKCALATPHIAGHSQEGKLNGTRMIYEAACRYLGVTPQWRPAQAPSDPLALKVEGKPDEALLLEAIRARYHIEKDDSALRAIVNGPDPSFRRYREQYPLRHELIGAQVNLSESRARLSAALSVLGASVVS